MDNKSLVAQWLTDVDKGDAGVVDNYLVDSFQDHNPPPFPGAGPDLEGARNAFTYALSVFSEFHHEVLEQFADGDFVISRVRGTGKHTGEFMGVPPSGKEVTMEGIAIHRIVDGKMVEHWAQVDALGLLMQMGAIPTP